MSQPIFFLDDFQQRNVSQRAKAGDISDQGTAEGAAAGVELAHTARDEVDQNVGVANFLQGLFAKFGVQDFYRLQKSPKRNNGIPARSNGKRAGNLRVTGGASRSCVTCLDAIHSAKNAMMNRGRSAGTPR